MFFNDIFMPKYYSFIATNATFAHFLLYVLQAFHQRNEGNVEKKQI